MELRGRARGRGVRWRAWCVLCGAAACVLWALYGGGGRALTVLTTSRAYPHVAPAALAHRLADFTTLPHAQSAIPGSWRVEEERGNYSVWRYRVRWACGARCFGAADVSAHALRVDLRVSTCLHGDANAGFWSWKTERCDEMEIVAKVESDGTGGAVLSERARAACDAGGEAACAGGLRAHRAVHHARLADSTFTG